MFGDVATYASAREMLMEEVNTFYAGKGYTNGYYPFTFEEAVAEAYIAIKELKDSLLKVSQGYEEVEDGRKVLVNGVNRLSEEDQIELEAAFSLTSGGKAFPILVETLFPDADVNQIYTALEMKVEQMDEEAKNTVGL
jgi:hypothetical protein